MYCKKILSAITIFLLLFGCKKDKEIESELLAGRCRISCAVSGAITSNYLSDDYYSFSAYNSVVMALDAVLINNTTSIRQDISLLIPIDITAGSYNLKSLGAPNITFTYLKKNIYLSDDKIWRAGVGSDFTVNITKVSYSEIEGTISGTAYNSVDSSNITISNGRFRTIFSH
jgi:hypothetical protein